MDNTIKVMHDKLMASLKEAGRVPIKIDRAMIDLLSDIDRQAGPRHIDWSEEYRLFLLDRFRLAVELVLTEAIESEEFEWAARLKKQAELMEPVEELEKLINDIL